MRKFHFTKLIVFIFAAALLLVSCGGANSSGEVVLTEENAVVIRADATSGTLFDLMNELSGAGEVTFSGSDGDYGYFIEAVNGKSADPTCEFWAVYTTLGELDGVTYSSADFGTYEYDGKTLASASYGVSGLPAVEGELYALVLEGF